MHAALLRRCPPASDGAELAQLSQALVEALERGELDLPLAPTCTDECGAFITAVNETDCPLYELLGIGKDTTDRSTFFRNRGETAMRVRCAWLPLATRDGRVN